MSATDYIIVGGGIIGMMTARELAIQGAKVALFDRAELGKEASWAAGGILSPMRPWAEHPDSAELSERGKQLYPEYIESLKQETGIDSEYIRSGLIIIDAEHAAKTKKWVSNNKVKLEEVTQNQFSNINIPEHAILLPEITQLNPSCLLKALHESLKQLNVSIYEHTEITNIIAKNNQFDYIEFNNRKEHAEAVIITAGAWSQLVLGDISEAVNIKPIRGQIIYVKPEKQITDKIILDAGHYFMSRQNGHVLIGSTMEDVGFVNETTKIARQELLAWACSISSEFSRAQFVRHWSGLRPLSDVGKPFIGPFSKVKNLYLNTGHFRKGILQAPASAKLLADYLSGKSMFMDIEKLSI